ncbi:MAG: glycine betaine ABC transporter substrate-binding protein [Thermodesulfobacteriota bacterium]|nr:glycine betaine ABC transporter substrate-binding protein [Thermodesulfobacteriota bacterium]
MESLHRTIGVIISACFLIVILTGCGKGPEEDGRELKTITIGSKHFTEQEIIAEIMAQMIEMNTDMKVIRKFNLGGTMVCFNALKSGDIDLYAEYTGTGLVNILKRKAQNDPEEVYQVVKETFHEEFGLVWLKPFGFNNTYTLTMRKRHAEKLGIKRISDIALHRNLLQPGFDAEFLERPDGYPGLAKKYGFTFKKRPKQMDPGLMYKACAEGAVDIIDGFATDGRISAYNLFVLEDDRSFFPPYYAAPLVREEVLAGNPKIDNVLIRLAGTISDETMQRLNFQVDKEEKRASLVARNFLLERKLIGE